MLEEFSRVAADALLKGNQFESEQHLQKLAVQARSAKVSDDSLAFYWAERFWKRKVLGPLSTSPRPNNALNTPDEMRRTLE